MKEPGSNRNLQLYIVYSFMLNRLGFFSLSMNMSFIKCINKVYRPTFIFFLMNNIVVYFSVPSTVLLCKLSLTLLYCTVLYSLQNWNTLYCVFFFGGGGPQKSRAGGRHVWVGGASQMTGIRTQFQSSVLLWYMVKVSQNLSQLSLHFFFTKYVANFEVLDATYHESWVVVKICLYCKGFIVGRA